MDIRKPKRTLPATPKNYVDYPPSNHITDHSSNNFPSYSWDKTKQSLPIPPDSFSNSQKRFYSAGIKFFLWLLLVGLLIISAYGSFFIYKLYTTQEKMNPAEFEQPGFLGTVKSLTSTKTVSLQGEDKERINILLLGTAGKGKPGQNLTDTIMIASINTKTNQVALLSIPRDFYVSVPGENVSLKINSAYQFGLNYYQDENKAIEKVKDIISDITMLEINYYVIVNFDGFEQAIDAIGGINITNQRDIYDARYPGPNYSYETFELKKGFHHLDGNGSDCLVLSHE